MPIQIRLQPGGEGDLIHFAHHFSPILLRTVVEAGKVQRAVDRKVGQFLTERDSPGGGLTLGIFDRDGYVAERRIGKTISREGQNVRRLVHASKSLIERSNFFVPCEKYVYETGFASVTGQGDFNRTPNGLELKAPAGVVENRNGEVTGRFHQSAISNLGQ